MPLSTLTRVKREVIHMGDLLVVRAKIKEAVKECNVAGDFAEALDKKVRELIKAAESRAKGNNRRTLMAKDL